RKVLTNSVSTAQRCLERLRAAMSPHGPLGNPVVLGLARPLGLSGPTVGIARNETGDEVQLAVLQDLSPETIAAFVRSVVMPSSTFITNNWTPWKDVAMSVKAGSHVPQQQSSSGTDEPWDNPRQAKYVAQRLEQWLAGMPPQAVWQVDWSGILTEFTFREQTRIGWSRGRRFYRLLKQALALKPTDRPQAQS
ncbi:MAG TPA: hypothetical protein VEC99_10550, partial [Clostridia bacterium]|nr:hypothetical protein [Clostridia bacterium]